MNTPENLANSLRALNFVALKNIILSEYFAEIAILHNIFARLLRDCKYLLDVRKVVRERENKIIFKK